MQPDFRFPGVPVAVMQMIMQFYQQRQQQMLQGAQQQHDRMQAFNERGWQAQDQHMARQHQLQMKMIDAASAERRTKMQAMRAKNPSRR